MAVVFFLFSFVFVCVILKIKKNRVSPSALQSSYEVWEYGGGVPDVMSVEGGVYSNVTQSSHPHIIIFQEQVENVS